MLTRNRDRSGNGGVAGGGIPSPTANGVNLKPWPGDTGAAGEDAGRSERPPCTGSNTDMLPLALLTDTQRSRSSPAGSCSPWGRSPPGGNRGAWAKVFERITTTGSGIHPARITRQRRPRPPLHPWQRYAVTERSSSGESARWACPVVRLLHICYMDYENGWN